MYMSNWKSNNPKQYDTNCATPEITILLGYDWFVSLKVVSSSTVETSKISSWTSSTKMASYPRRMGTSLTQQWKYRNSHRLTCWLQYALLWFFWQLFNQEHKYPSYICFAWIQERLITYIPRITQGLQKKKKTDGSARHVYKTTVLHEPTTISYCTYYLASLSNACPNPKSCWHWIW